MRKIENIQVSVGFWNDLGKCRAHRNYTKKREGMARVLKNVSDGHLQFLRVFTNPAMAGLSHFTSSSLDCVVFCSLEGSTLSVLGMTEHNEYGHNRKNSSREGITAERMRKRAEGPWAVSPNWSALSWSSPADIATSRELVELSATALVDLSLDLAKEADDFAKFERVAKGLPQAQRMRAFDTWVDDIAAADRALTAAQHAVELAKGRGPALPFAQTVFAGWIEDPLAVTYELAA